MVKKELNRNNVPARVDGSKIGIFGGGEDVELCIKEGRESVPEAGKDGVLRHKVVPERLKGRNRGSRAKMQLGNSEDKDGERRDEEEESADASRTEREPGPEQAGASHGNRDEPACCKTNQSSTGESSVQGRSEEVAVWTSAGHRLDRRRWVHVDTHQRGREVICTLLMVALARTKHKREAAHAAKQPPFRSRTSPSRLPRLSPHSPSRRAIIQAPTLSLYPSSYIDNHVVPRLAQPRRQASTLPTSRWLAHSNTRIAQPTNWRRSDDPEYQDDPEFNSFTTDLSDRLFSLTANISRLSSQVALLGTKRETDRVRERVQDLLEETSASFKDIGDGLKKVQAWHDLGV